MGTSNYHNKNASKIYSFELDYEDAYEDIRDSVSAELSANDKAGLIEFAPDKSLELLSVLRSYPATSIGTVYNNFTFLNVNFEVEVIVMTRAAYYDGGNLDYEIRYNVDGEVYESIEDLCETIENYADDYEITPGIAALHLNKLPNKLEKLKDELVTIVEDVFQNYTDSLEVAAVASTGEISYKKVS